MGFVCYYPGTGPALNQGAKGNKALQLLLLTDWLLVKLLPNFTVRDECELLGFCFKYTKVFFPLNIVQLCWEVHFQYLL